MRQIQLTKLIAWLLRRILLPILLHNRCPHAYIFQLVLEFFCDASVGRQGATTPNQTGIGIFILTTPAWSVSHASFFFQVVIPQVTPTLLLGAKLAMALNLHDATLCSLCWQSGASNGCSCWFASNSSGLYFLNCRRPVKLETSHSSRSEESQTKRLTHLRKKQGVLESQTLVFSLARH